MPNAEGSGATARVARVVVSPDIGRGRERDRTTCEALLSPRLAGRAARPSYSRSRRGRKEGNFRANRRPALGTIPVWAVVGTQNGIAAKISPRSIVEPRAIPSAFEGWLRVR